MPQMNPIWWLSLMSTFLLLLLLTNTMNYFYKNYSTSSNKNIKFNSKSFKNWKW